ncbi:MAG: COX15/CtaA family protein [Armatimonadota bacterium]|nr:COX15/CtaA family protein [Armatimonadota bacterium]
MAPKERKFVRFAVFVLIFNLAVIAWGAFVRHSFSGDGCGSHWPLCNGEVFPANPTTATIIEFAHRTTSFLALVFVVALLVIAIRTFPKGHGARIAAWLALTFTLVSAAIGALLVVFGWVGKDDSMGRAITLSMHLINTMLLLGALIHIIWWGAGRPRVPLGGQGVTGWIVVVGSLAVLFVGMSGAVTSLGDTIYPRDSSLQVISEGLSPTGHFLLRLRLWHPLIAVGSAFVLYFSVLVLSQVCERREVRSFGRDVLILVAAQLLLGLASVWLKAPTLLAILHLLLADALWIVVIRLWLSALESPKRRLATSDPLPAEG